MRRNAKGGAWPRRKSPLQLVAFTAVLLAGFEMVQTYWLYTYIPWFFPFAAIALLVPATGLRRLVDRGSGVDGERLDPPSLPVVGSAVMLGGDQRCPGSAAASTPVAPP